MMAQAIAETIAVAIRIMPMVLRISIAVISISFGLLAGIDYIVDPRCKRPARSV
jgi:hypothetical protein